VGDEVGEVARRDADVGVGDEQHVVARVRREVGEVVDLGVEADAARVDDDAAGDAWVSRRDPSGDHNCRVVAVCDAEDDLVARVVEAEEALQVALEVGVEPLERLEQADRRRFSAERRGGDA
jgi:hypothetical protein